MSDKQKFTSKVRNAAKAPTPLVQEGSTFAGHPATEKSKKLKRAHPYEKSESVLQLL